jgi:hypothetical protein
MTTYKEIKGTQIEVLASDPSNPVEGQVWYNSTSNVLKGSVRTTVGAWASAPNMNTARSSGGGSPAGNYQAALFSGGYTGTTETGVVESYNGTSWTEVNDLNKARYDIGGAGTYTSALAFGGQPSGSPPALLNNNESWNGTNWTEVNDLTTSVQQAGGVGASNTSALAFGGYGPTPGGPQVALTESWNGSNWTEVNDLNQARGYLGGIGIATAALGFGGSLFPGTSANTELWNGTNWTEVNNLNVSKEGQRGAGNSGNTAGLCIGQTPTAPLGDTEEWNGTNWTEVNPLNTVRFNGRGTGTTSKALYYGGQAPSGRSVATEEWTAAGAAVTRTFTDS